MVVAGAAVPSAAAFGNDNRTRSRGEYAGAARRTDVDAVVAMETLREHASIDRPGVVPPQVGASAAAVQVDSGLLDADGGRGRDRKLSVGDYERDADRQRGAGVEVVILRYLGGVGLVP